MIEIDGFLFAFMGTFSVSVLQGSVPSPFKRSAMNVAVLPLMLWAAISILSGVVEFLPDSPVSRTLLSIPVTALAAALALSFLLLGYARMIVSPRGIPEQP